MKYKLEEIDEIKDKPNDWPANAIECQLENIQNQIYKFKKEPSYRNKAILISLFSDYDLNQRSMLGLWRTTEYEIARINSLFLDATILQLNSLKVYLYELVGNKTRMQKMISYFPECSETLEIELFERLVPQLKLHYYAYQKFTVEKSKSYTEQLIEVIEDIIAIESNNKIKKEIIASITHAYISLLNDISNFRCVRRTGIWAFNRNEIYSLYKLVAKLIKLNEDNPVKRPLKGVLMTSISNYVLKSRNNYNEDYICKYVTPEVAKQSIKNHQIWMSIIENLNDEKEGKVIPKLFEETEWNNYDWFKGIDFLPTRKYYVSCFCKSIDNADMIKNYGECIYGYKDDRMVELLAPIMYYHENIPMFSQVIAFDVLYDLEEAKEEINFLCSIIELFNINDVDKKSFLEEILQYWILSVKEPKWSYERERRYVLFMYDIYHYNEIDFSDSKYLKLKTSVFIEPDFILGKNPVKPHIKAMIDDKRKAISMKPYLFCHDCLNRDYDIVTGIKQPDKCPICESRNISIEKLKHF